MTDVVSYGTLIEQLDTAEELTNYGQVPRSTVFELRIQSAELLKSKAAQELETRRLTNLTPTHLYLEALFQIDFFPPQYSQVPANNLFFIEDMQSKILANLALCFLNAGNFFLANRAADLGLKRAKTPELSAKIIYRKSQALKEIGNIPAARTAAEAASQFSPDDLKIQDLVKELRIKEIEYLEREAEEKKAAELIAAEEAAREVAAQVEPPAYYENWFCCRRRKIE